MKQVLQHTNVLMAGLDTPALRLHHPWAERRPLRPALGKNGNVVVASDMVQCQQGQRARLAGTRDDEGN